VKKLSELEELIAALCPDGVEYKELGEFGTMIRGNGLQKKDFTNTGVGCIHYGQIYTFYGTFAYETKTFVSLDLAGQLKKVNTGDLVIAITSENVEDVCKCVAWLGDEEIVTGGHSAIFKHNQDPKYLSYYFQTAAFFAQKKKIANGAAENIQRIL
jgi:type I restriction enzyme S subunit